MDQKNQASENVEGQVRVDIEKNKKAAFDEAIKIFGDPIKDPKNATNFHFQTMFWVYCAIKEAELSAEDGMAHYTQKEMAHLLQTKLPKIKKAIREMEDKGLLFTWGEDLTPPSQMYATRENYIRYAEEKYRVEE